MEEEEDKLLLSSLGVTSGVAEDIEKDILKQAEDNSKCNGKNSDNGIHPCESSKDPTSSIGNKLYNRLHALEFEIDAVAASINYTNDAEGIQDCDLDGFTNKEGHTNKNATNAVQITPDGLTIQQALASERLRSLKRTRDQLQSEIEKFDAGTSTDELLGEVVEEETKHKHKPPNQVQHPGRKLKKRTIAFNEDADFDALLDAASTGFVETERDALVRKGVLTPFHSLKGFERRIQQAGSSNRLDFPEEETNETFASASIAKVAQAMSDIAESRSTTKLLDAKSLPKLDGPTHYFQKLKTPLKHALPPTSEHEKDKIKKSKRPLPDRKWRKIVENENLLQTRADEDERKDSDLDSEADEHEEVEDSDDSRSSCIVLEGGLKIPEVIFTRLFDYQKVGVQWLWELHCQKAGGIIGDEMGLGKTIQVISFLGALHYSKMYRPSIVVCPVTLLRQWQREAKKWYPKFHVEILHESAHGSFRPAQKRGSDSDYESEEGSSENERLQPAKSNRWDNLISAVLKSKSGLLVTTYEQLRILGKKLLDVEWGYAVLDEGHRIRNPNADITLICKQMQTVHRIIMTGAPLQNKLAELWSLFDFIFPGKLGVLPVFEMEFAVPITVGGYANATPLQVSTAYRCAVVLRDLIMPYLLRRMKADVDAQLPKKTEHVLFCSLTSDQRALYRAFLASSEVEQIFDGNRNSLYGIDIMRKICNHPDLLEREHAAKHPDYGNPDRCGKMKVVAQVLQQWKEQGHRALVFTQTQQMLDILESFLTSCGYIYRRMDGLTPVKQRMALIDEFNNCAEVFVFILTTKVGGLGTNLIGANRVIIYDPDWNPSTDMQARERAWRIGQTRDVTVYRLITRGTIEEKIYHRQIYKHFLTNKVLKNPQQKRFFKARDMKDLFTLQDEEGQNSTETSNIFSQLIGDVNIGIHGDGDSKKASYIASVSTSNDVNAANHCDPPTESSVMKSKVKSNKGICEQDEETSILRSLFYANGIHSVVNHDVIMNANDNDRIRMEEQASLVAQKAAEALRQSRMLRRQESFSVPTWTGKSGTAGAPSSARRRFGSTVNSSLISNLKHSSEGSSRPGFQVGVSTGRALSSAELLARTRGNREKAACDGLEHQLGSSSSSCQATSATSRSRSSNRSMIVQPEVLIRQLCTFIQQRGGSADSGSIVQHFKDRIPTKDHPIFRSLLKEIALLEKDAEGCRSKWVLKSEYQE